MLFIRCNIYAKKSVIIENTLDSKLKTIGYSKKYSDNQAKITSYLDVMIPVLDDIGDLNNLYDPMKIDNIRRVYPYEISENDTFIHSIYSVLEDDKLTDVNIEVIEIVDSSAFEIVYSDGGVKWGPEGPSKNSTDVIAAYGLVRLLDESLDGDVIYDEMTNKHYTYIEESSKFPGTSNQGELTGIKRAIQGSVSDKPIFLVSDSEYGIKTYREYYFKWQDNGFKRPGGKPILNMDIISETVSSLMNKTVIFRWVKGHSGDTLNERCDELVREVLAE